MSTEKLIVEFEKELEVLIRICIKEVYRPTLFLRMVGEIGYYSASKKLISKPENTEGFMKLLMEDRTDLSIEHLVVQPKYSSLFTKYDIKVCKQRLGI